MRFVRHFWGVLRPPDFTDYCRHIEQHFSVRVLSGPEPVRTMRHPAQHRIRLPGPAVEFFPLACRIARRAVAFGSCMCLLQALAEPKTSDAADVTLARLRILTVSAPLIEGKDISFKRLPKTAGLSQTRVAEITQDNDGFLWFGTQNGLNRYDGYKCKVFKHDTKLRGSLSGATSTHYSKTDLAPCGSEVISTWIDSIP